MLSKDTTASLVETKKHKNWRATKMLVQRICRSFGNLREWHRGCNTEDGGTPCFWWWESRSPFCLGRQTSFAMEMWNNKGGRYWEFCEDVLYFTLASQVSFQDDSSQQQFSCIFWCCFLDVAIISLYPWSSPRILSPWLFVWFLSTL